MSVTEQARTYAQLLQEFRELEREHARLVSEVSHHATYGDPRGCQSCQQVLNEVDTERRIKRYGIHLEATRTDQQMEQTRVLRHEETADYWRAMHDEQVSKKQNLHERYVDLHDEVDRLRRENGRLLSELRHHATYDDRPCQSCQAILIEVGG